MHSAVAARAAGFDYLDAEQKSFDLYKQAAIFAHEIVAADDGVALSVYSAGDVANPMVVLANPLGVSCLFLTRLAQRLARDYHVFTWESRGLPRYLAASHADGAWPLELHCRDLAAILRHKSRRCHAVVSYCSGANVAAAALANRYVDAPRLCLVSPSLQMGDAGRKTNYQRSVLPLWPRVVAEGPRMAGLVRTLLRQPEPRHASALDRELSVINNLPFQSDACLYRYAQLHSPCVRQDAGALLRAVSVPAMVIHSENDDLIHGDTARAVAGALPEARLEWIAEGGHFAVYRSTDMHEKIAAFLAR